MGAYDSTPHIGALKASQGSRYLAKVPVVMQMEMMECGAASLSMVLASFGKWVTLEEARSACGISRNGSNAYNILMAARSFGLESKAFRWETEDFTEKASFPCIVHWDMNHFLVVRGVRGNKVYLVDPGNGRRTVSLEEFDRSFTGFALMFAPGDEFVAGGKQKSIWGFVKRNMKGAAGITVVAAAISAATALLGMATPYLSSAMMTYAMGDNADESLRRPLFLLMLLVAVLTFAVSAFNVSRMIKWGNRFNASASTAFIWHILHLPMEFFSQRTAADIGQRASLNAGVTSSLVTTFAPLALSCVSAAIYLFILFSYGPVLASIGVSGVIINLVMAQLAARKRTDLTKGQMRDLAMVQSATVTGMQMIETVKSSGAEEGFFAQWAGYQANASNAKTRILRETLVYQMLPSVVTSLANIFVMITGVARILHGDFTIGALYAFQGMLSQFTGPSNQLVTAGQTIMEMRSSMERIDDVMDYPEQSAFAPREEERSGGVGEKLKGNIVFKDVTFGYSPLDEPLLKHFDMELHPGEFVAVVGPSGCGKSTLAKLAMGLYKPWSGEILYDGKPLSEIQSDVFFGSVAMVDQDVTMFADTIANNIRMWDSTITDESMSRAAKDAQINTMIMGRPGAYNNILREDGADMSGGERQRLEIARALAQDPSILVLDEATSALDSKTERDVVQALFRRNITSLIIAHRLSTIRQADRIIVLESGRIVETGTHDELMAKDGVYASLQENE